MSVLALLHSGDVMILQIVVQLVTESATYFSIASGYV